MSALSETSLQAELQMIQANLRFLQLSLHSSPQKAPQKAIWNISEFFGIFFLPHFILAAAGKVRAHRRETCRRRQGHSDPRAPPNTQMNIMADPRGTIKGKKLEYGLLATDLALISEVSLHLATSPRWRQTEGEGQTHDCIFFCSPCCEEVSSADAVCCDRLHGRKFV